LSGISAEVDAGKGGMEDQGTLGVWHIFEKIPCYDFDPVRQFQLTLYGLGHH